MSVIPDFTTIDLHGGGFTGLDGEQIAAGRAHLSETPEGIDICAVATAADIADFDFPHTLPGFAPFLRGPYPTMYVNQPWDHPAVRGVFNRRRIQRLLSPQPGRRPKRTLHSFRSAHTPRL